MTHLEFFNDSLNRIVAIVPGTYAAFVSQDGLVLHSNVEDEFVEKQLGSSASQYLDQGKKVFSAPVSATGTLSKEVQTSITVGGDRVFMVTPFLNDAFLVVVSPEKSRVNEFLKRSLEEVERLQQLIASQDIHF